MVLIEWIDSKSGSSEWEYIEDMEPIIPAMCKSIGFLVDETDQYKTLAQTVSEEQLISRITIPCCAIKNIKEIEFIGL